MTLSNAFKRLNILVVFQLCVALVAIGLPIVIWNAGAAKQNNALQEQGHRLLRTEKTKLSQAIEILQDHSQLINGESPNGASLESFALSVIEEIEQRAEIEGLTISHLSVKPQEATDYSMQLHALRVDLRIQLNHTMRLLPILDAIKYVADWRPLEIRRCSVLRISVDAIDLQTNCSIDVYYYPGIDL